MGIKLDKQERVGIPVKIITAMTVSDEFARRDNSIIHTLPQKRSSIIT